MRPQSVRVFRGYPTLGTILWGISPPLLHSASTMSTPSEKKKFRPLIALRLRDASEGALAVGIQTAGAVILHEDGHSA